MTEFYFCLAGRWLPRAGSIALVCILGACSADADLSGPAPTPFWLQDAADSSGAGADSDAFSDDTFSDDAFSDGGTAAPDGGGDGVSPDAADTDAASSPVPDADASAPDGSGQPTDANVDAGAEAVAVDAAEGEAEQYFVSWLETAQQLQDPSPFGDSWVDQRTYTMGLVKVQWKGNQGSRWHQPCAMHTTSNFNTKTLYSAAFLSTIPVQETAMSRQGLQWSQEEELQTIGLKAGFTGAMPSLGQKDHPALADTDKDGLPGATVYIDNILLGKQSIQVAQRSKTTWTGAVKPNGQVTAEPKVQTEQVVVAASLSLLVTQNNVKAVQGKPPETLLWRPLAQPINCKILLADAPKYAGRAWPP